MNQVKAAIKSHTHLPESDPASEESPALLWLTAHGPKVVYAVIGIAIVLMIFSRFASSSQANAEADYILAENHLVQLQQEGTAHDETLRSLKEILGRRPELRAKYDTLLCQTLIKQGSEETAVEFGTAALDRTEELLNTLHQNYARTTLLIAGGELAEARKEATELQQKVIAGEYPTLHAFNLLRIAFLNDQIGSGQEAELAWAAVTDPKNAAVMEPVIELFNENSLTITDFIQRKRS